MNPIRNVLAATDLSDNALPALKAAAQLAELCNAELWVVHVVPPVDTAHEALLGEARDKIEARAKAALSEVCRALKKPPVPSNVILEQGDPATKIHEACKRLSIDVLVAGTRGHGGSDKKTMGRVAERLAHTAVCDVLLVRPDFKKGFSKICVAVDFSGPSLMALERAAELARTYKTAKLTLCHVVHIPDDYWHSGISEKETIRRMRGFAKEHMAELQAKCDLEGLKCKEAYNEGSPATELAKLTKGEGADLLVIGSHGSTAAASAVIGSVAAKTVSAVPCSIWIETDPSFKRTFLTALGALMGLGD